MGKMTDRKTPHWESLKQALGRARKMRVVVGWIGQQAGLGALHEFGAPKKRIPERSVIRATFDAKRGELAALQAQLAGQIIAGKTTVERALGIMGLRFQAWCQQRIGSGGFLAPNAPRTIARKGSDRPLVDTGQLVQAITFSVRAG
jgi:hypothetical protein